MKSVSSDALVLARFTSRRTSSISFWVVISCPLHSTFVTLLDSNLPVTAFACRPIFRWCSWRLRRSRSRGERVLRKEDRCSSCFFLALRYAFLALRLRCSICSLVRWPVGASIPAARFLRRHRRALIFLRCFTLPFLSFRRVGYLRFIATSQKASFRSSFATLGENSTFPIFSFRHFFSALFMHFVRRKSIASASCTCWWLRGTPYVVEASRWN